MTQINCPFHKDNHCGLVSQLLDKPCTVSDNTCLHCMSSDRPCRINLVTINLAQKVADSKTNHLSLDISNPSILDQLGNGFGSRLHALISPFLSEVEGCSCSGHQDILDLWTPEYIEKNIDRVVEWLAHEARNRKLPFSYIATRISLLSLLRFS